MRRAIVLVVVFVAGCAAAADPAWPDLASGIRVYMEGVAGGAPPPTQLELPDGQTVSLVGIHEIRLPDEVSGALVDYVTNRDLGDPLLFDEARAVWGLVRTKVVQAGHMTAVIRGLDRPIPQAGTVAFRAVAFRVCVTTGGDDLWIHFDGSIPLDAMTRDLRCASATPPGA